jgi:hypothetical protein
LIIGIKLAFYLFCAAVALGAGLAINFMRGAAASRPPWPIGVTHGVFGAAALAVLLWLLRNGPPPSEMGTAGFAPTAAIMLGLALVLGLGIALYRRRPPGVLIAAHASLAIAGFVVLWTVVSLG